MKKITFLSFIICSFLSFEISYASEDPTELLIREYLNTRGSSTVSIVVTPSRIKDQRQIDFNLGDSLSEMKDKIKRVFHENVDKVFYRMRLVTDENCSEMLETMRMEGGQVLFVPAKQQEE